MNDYSKVHQHPTNQLIHKICVPVITFLVIGLLWELPFPFHTSIFWINWSTLFISTCLIFYFYLKPAMALVMSLQSTIFLWTVYYLNQQQLNLALSSTLFVLAWIAQFYGHKVEGKKPSFFTDLIFLLVGPLWVWCWAFNKLGIKI